MYSSTLKARALNVVHDMEGVEVGKVGVDSISRVTRAESVASVVHKCERLGYYALPLIPVHASLLMRPVRPHPAISF